LFSFDVRHGVESPESKKGSPGEERDKKGQKKEDRRGAHWRVSER
jgi:hypothetical protein